MYEQNNRLCLNPWFKFSWCVGKSLLCFTKWNYLKNYRSCYSWIAFKLSFFDCDDQAHFWSWTRLCLYKENFLSCPGLTLCWKPAHSSIIIHARQQTSASSSLWKRLICQFAKIRFEKGMNWSYLMISIIPYIPRKY